MIDTICALATPRGLAALAIIRLSGPGVARFMEEALGRQLEHRRATFVPLKNRANDYLDEVVATFYKGPASYTGEDLLEICCHGNELVVEAILSEIVSRETCRMAEPGEFSRRAVGYGKLSLYDVEALEQIYLAQNPAAAALSVKRKIQGPGRDFEDAQNHFREILIALQSQLDFQEEEVGPFDRAAVKERLLTLRANLTRWLGAFEAEQSWFKMPVIVLLGRPNAGKSSLFNRLVGFDRAIVHEKPGTTRDTIEMQINRHGRTYLLVDTAGIRQESEAVEAEGIKRALDATKRADLVLWVSENQEVPISGLTEAQLLKVASKADLASAQNGLEGQGNSEWLKVSSLSGQGLENLEKVLFREVEAAADGPLASKRQAGLIEKASESLKLALETLDGGGYLDLVTEKVLEASQFLGELVETADHEATLKAIFSRFCIGK